MASSTTAWYNLPARPFPAKVWLAARFSFRIPTVTPAPQAAPAAQPQRRPVPAKVWRERAGGRSRRLHDDPTGLHRPAKGTVSS